MKFRRHQKVYCWYHSTRWFKPPMCGKIMLRYPVRKMHHFSRDEDGKCFWWFVRMSNGLIVLMPEPCIDDLEESIEKDNEYLYKSVVEREMHNKSGIESWLHLQKWQAEKMLYELKK